MEFWRFIFSSFWVWLGFIILVSIVGGGVVELVKACKRNRKVSISRVGKQLRVDVENASEDDAHIAFINVRYEPDLEAEQEDQGNV